MGVEEQAEEREVLAAIFPDEITDISDNEINILITLDVSEEDNGDAESAPALILHVTFTPNYPDEAPDLTIMAPPDAPKHPYIDVTTDREQLLANLTSTVEENIGMAMIFTVVMALKDHAEQLITERAQVTRDHHAAIKAKLEEEENRKFAGTPVTRETFLAWREKFRKDAEEAERLRLEEIIANDRSRKAAGKDEIKLTGRQLWERGLAGKVEEDIDDDGVDALEGVERLKIQA